MCFNRSDEEGFLISLLIGYCFKIYRDWIAYQTLSEFNIHIRKSLRVMRITRKYTYIIATGRNFKGG